MPVPFSDAGVRITRAPRKRISRRRSTLKFSAIVTTSGYPFAAQTMASPMPVLPLVASITVWPGFSVPVAFGRLDHPERQPVLDRAHRVERLELGVELDAGRRQPVQPHHRRAADGREDAVVQGHGLSSAERSGILPAAKPAGQSLPSPSGLACDGAPR